MQLESHNRQGQVWLGLDGIDATGKSTTVATLRRQIRGSVVVDEFSKTRVGDLIREVIDLQRFFSLSQKGSTVLADLCLILTDWVAKREFAAADSRAFFISDRSFTSVVGYQIARARVKLRKSRADRIQNALVDFVTAIQSSQPHFLSCELLLKITGQQMIARMKERGESMPDAPRLKELLLAQDIMCDLIPSKFILEVGTLTRKEVAAEAMLRARWFLSNHPRRSSVPKLTAFLETNKG